ncbi:DUF6508 domain-containing protein [Streptomyces sp. NPDC051207]|uniref:DUF6508 domain-containing protein n=1 Tax=Streptomyces sp. NPDC051207 TaxID=3154641 RepID=UPI00344AF691
MSETAMSLHYVTVTTPTQEVAGFLWADATDVGWTDRLAGSVAAYHAGREWARQAREAHERGLAPLGVLNLLSREPGAGPVTAAPGKETVEELARIVTPEDDRRLLAQLAPPDDDAWRELAEAFDALTDEDRDVKWGGGHKLPSGATHVAFPLYSKPLQRAVDALHGVGAVTPEHRWMGVPMPKPPPEGQLLAPADAVRAATAIVRGERFCDGHIAESVEDGLFDAVAATLRAWHASGATADTSTVTADTMRATADAPAATVATDSSVPADRPPHQPPAVCRFCGGSPAVDVTFRAHQALLVLMRFKKTAGPMCLTCGLAVYRTLTTYTLWQGWWSPFSLFVFAPLALVRNALAVRHVRKLAAPGPGTGGPRFDPGVPVRRRPLAYVGLVPVLWVLVMIVSGLAGGA